MIDLTGQQLGRYRLIRPLGAGGYAQVYEGEHIHLKTKVAIKVLTAQVMTQEVQEKFREEAQRIASLKHDHIVSVTDFDVVGNMAFLVMEYAPRGTPKRTNGVPLAFPLITTYIKQIASALQYIHDDQRKLVHCDVKPLNMLLWEHNLIKLSDFGTAEFARDTNASMLTHIEGTSPYMSPEHWQGKPVAASDQYALGVVAYEWLSGDVPFRGSSFDLQRQHLHDAPPPLHRRNPAIPMTVEQVVNRALRKNPHERYPRVVDFANALESALRYAAQSSARTQASRIPGENSLPPLPPLLLREQQQSPRTAPHGQPHSNPLILASPTSNDFQSHFDPTLAVMGTPLPLEEPELPMHELLLEQQKLIQHFVKKGQEQDERETAIRQQRVADREGAAEKRKQDLIKTDEDVEKIRRYTEEMRGRVGQQGWAGLAQRFNRAPFAFLSDNTPSQQIHEFRQDAESAYDAVISFLRQYEEPQQLLNMSIRVGGACVMLAAFVWIFGVSILHLWTTWTFIGMLCVLLLVFLAAVGSFGYTRIANMGSALHRLKQLAAITEETQQLRRQLIEESYQRQLRRVDEQFQTALTQLTQALQQQLPARKAEVDAFMQKIGLAGMSWNDPRWQSRLPNRISPPVTRIGQLTFNTSAPFPALPVIPTLVSCPNGSNLLLEASGAAKGAVNSAVLSFILRLLLTQQPGNVQFTFIDPTRYGESFEPFLWLSEHPDLLPAGGVLAAPLQIEQQLADLTGHILRITQQRSRSLRQGAEPYRVLVVMDFPAYFSATAARNLLDIAQNGPRCGISTVVVIDEARSLEALHNFDLSTLEQLATVIRWNGQNFTLQSDDTQNCYLELDRLPEESVYQPLQQSLQQSLHASTTIEQHPLLQEVLERPHWLAQHEEAQVWLGTPLAAKEPIALSFSRQSGSNLLIVGKKSEANSGMLMAALLNLAAQQSPRRAQFYVLDLSMGNMGEALGLGNQPFASIKQWLAGYSIQVVQRRNVRSDLPAFLSTLSSEMRRRTRPENVETSSLYLFIGGLERIHDLRQADGENDASHIASDTTKLLARILRNGSDFGIHMLASCNTLSNFTDLLGERALAHFDNRVIFPPSSKEEMVALLEQPDVPAIDSGLALFFSRDPRRLEKFRPFQQPSKEWLQRAAETIRRKRES